MKRVLTIMWRKLVTFLLCEETILLIAYFALLFILAFGFDILFTLWKAIIN